MFDAGFLPPLHMTFVSVGESASSPRQQSGACSADEMDLASQALWPLCLANVRHAGYRTDFVLRLAAEPRVLNSYVLCIPTSGPSLMFSSWLVASLALVLVTLIPGDLDSISLGIEWPELHLCPHEFIRYGLVGT